MNLLSTGEVSKQFQVSIRTLRYYDQIGLLIPSEKNDNGNRLYSQEDLHMLQKISLLKSLSLPLTEIKKVIDDITIREILAAQKRELEEKVKQLNDASDKTNTLLHILEIEGELDWQQLLSLIEANESAKKQERTRTWNGWFTPKEQKTLQSNLPKMEDSRTAKWINIIKRIELCLKRKSEPSSEEGQFIASDVLLLSEEMFNGNKDLEAKFWEARKSEDSSQSLGLYPVNQRVITFMEEAIQEYTEKVFILGGEKNE
jgi:MerR family transcriptional regulator, thiopeptide resistance regulator